LIYQGEKIMRHEEPEWLKIAKYYRMNWPPRVCHTCDHYDESGQCRQFGMEPPADFASTDRACTEWVEEVPF
jgi:hypothetical protein